MLVDYIVIGIIIVSIALIIYIAFKKFPVLSSINLNAIKKHQQDKIKKGLLEERLVRKLKSMNIKKIIGAGQTKGEGAVVDNKNWLGRTYEKLRDIEKKYQDKIKDQAPVDVEEEKKKKNILLAEAEELADKEEWKLAEEKYIELISLDSKSNEAYEGLADVYFDMKDYEHAKEIYKYLLKANSQDDAEVSTQNDGDENKSVSLNSTLSSYQVDLGEVYMATNEYSQAMNCFKEAIKLEPNNPKNLNSLLEVAIKIKDIDLAEDTFKKLKEVNPENEKLDEIKEQIKELKK